MSADPSVVAIVTSRDRPAGLARALESIRAQQRPVDEIVVVDDGSRIPVRLDEAPGLKLFRNERSMGAAHARNLGVERSAADVLMFLDDDDAWLPDKVGAQLDRFAACPDADLVYSGRVIQREEDGRVLRRVASGVEGKVWPRMLWGNVVGVTSAVAVRRKAFVAAGGFDPDAPLREDYDLWLRLARAAPIAWDGGHRVLYSVAQDPGRQRSAGPGPNRACVVYLLRKHRDAIASLTFLQRRRARAEKWFTAARHVRRSGWAAAAPLALRAFLEFPRPAALALLLPASFLGRFGV